METNLNSNFDSPRTSVPKISIIIPVINEFDNLSLLLPELKKAIKQQDVATEIIVVDGRSNDGSFVLAKQHADETIKSAKGRAIQQNKGSENANGRYLWFVHADSHLDYAHFSAYLTHIQSQQWGWFSVRINSPKSIYTVISKFINMRSRLSRIATGDQGIFIEKNLFLQVGKFPKQLLMEDIELCKRMKSLSKPYLSNLKISTSARKWQKEGVFKIIFLMWKIRLLYFLGTDAEKLHRMYYQ